MPVLAKVTQRDLTIYCKRQGWINELKKRNETLKEKMRDWLLAGRDLPDEGPYLIELAPNGGTELDWEAEYKGLLIKQLVSEGFSIVPALIEAEKRMEVIAKSAPKKKPVTVLGKDYTGGFKFQVRQNPTYRQQQQVA